MIELRAEIRIHGLCANRFHSVNGLFLLAQLCWPVVRAIRWNKLPGRLRASAPRLAKVGGGRDTVGLEAGARVAERFYYVAKYQASLEQRRVAEATGRAVTRKLATRASTRGSKTPRYLAVRTQSDRRAKTRTSVMLWDTQSQEIVGNAVYDLNESPPSRTIVNFETYSAQYVGTGG